MARNANVKLGDRLEHMVNSIRVVNIMCFVVFRCAHVNYYLIDFESATDPLSLCHSVSLRSNLHHQRLVSSFNSFIYKRKKWLLQVRFNSTSLSRANILRQQHDSSSSQRRARFHVPIARFILISNVHRFQRKQRESLNISIP